MFFFIDDVEYSNDGTARINYTIDEYSTWHDYYTMLPCFVEREHVIDDTIGLHTVPEGLETGEYIINDAGIITNKLRREACYICMGVSFVPANTLWVTDERMYGNIFSGLTYVIFSLEENASKFVRVYDKMGRGDAIVNMFMLPSSLVIDPQWQTGSYEDITDITFALLPTSMSDMKIDSDLTFNINSSINGYIPKNNKLYVFPYNFLSLSNNSGSQLDFRYEDFINNTPIFDVFAVESANVPCIVRPKNYKLYNNSSSINDIFYNYGLSMGKLPQCSWQTDLYTNWMTHNGVNILGTKIDAPTSHAIGGSLQALSSAATMDVVGIGSGLGQMFGSVQEMYRHSMQSPALNGQLSISDLTFSHDVLTGTYYKISIRREYAEIIDNWFSRFGYKINRVKIPNHSNRENFNYIKIGAGENIGYSNNNTRSIPAKSMDIINNIYRNGVTVWNNHTNLGNYNISNNITQ